MLKASQGIEVKSPWAVKLNAFRPTAFLIFNSLLLQNKQVGKVPLLFVDKDNLKPKLDSFCPFGAKVETKKNCYLVQ